jgi:hypothetical protein
VAVAHGRVGDSTRFWSFIQSAKPFRAELIEPLPGARLRDREKGGSAARPASAGGKGRPLVSGWPLTVTSAM